MTELHKELVPALIETAIRVSNRAYDRVHEDNIPGSLLQCALGATSMTAFLEAAQTLVVRCGMSVEGFAQGLRMHADEIEEQQQLQGTSENTRH